MKIKELLSEVTRWESHWTVINPDEFRKITKQLYFKQFDQLKKYHRQDLLASLLYSIISRYKLQQDDVVNTPKDVNLQTSDEKKLLYVSNIVRHIVDEGQPIVMDEYTLWDKTTKIDNFTIYAWLIRSLLIEKLNLHDVTDAKGEVQSFIDHVRNNRQANQLFTKFVDYREGYPWTLYDVRQNVDEFGLGSSQPNQEMAKKDLEDIIKSGDAGIIFKNNNFTLYEPRTQQASCIIGYDTAWCTAYGYKHGRHPNRSKNQWQNYIQKGNFYIFDFHDGKSIFGIYLGRERTEYKNKKNIELNKSEGQLLANAVKQLPSNIQQMLLNKGLDITSIS